MTSFNVNLNIHYSQIDQYSHILSKLYKEMDGWIGYIQGIPYWYGYDGNEETISASLEPSGLSFYAVMEETKWINWINKFKKRATELMGYEIGESEDGFAFPL